MPNNILPISQVRSQLPQLVQQAADLSSKTYITVNGTPQAVLISAKELQLLESTLEVLNDPTTMQNIQKGQSDIASEKLIDWQDIKQELNLE